MLQRFLSLLVAGWYLYRAYSSAGPDTALKAGFLLLIPLSCIWFSGTLGRFTCRLGPGRSGITATTPGCFIKLAGWFLLLTPLLYPFIIKMTEAK